jgi:cytochrome b involved in lipid metabolism
VSITRDQFETLLKRGEQLMILDDLVLNVSQFINVHPGGKFVLQHTIGTDISKFFFGGYSLEGNIGTHTRGHSHSSDARLIVNDLAIAIYERNIPTTT